ncbi:MAG: alpha/beta hydrolase [Myxococcota bacterium]
MWWSLLGCAPLPEVVLEADDSRLGDWGEPGPHGVVLEQRAAVARVEERLVYDWIAPLDVRDDDPVVLFVHGGLVDRERYRWLGIHLASRGYTVAAPAHDLDLAIFDAANVRFVLDDLERRSEPSSVAACGHSLGGVIASWAWQDDDRIDALCLLASFPAGEGPVDGSGPVLSISGASDGSALPDDVRAGAERYARARLAFVDGMNHYAWTDGATEGELAGDGPLGRPLEEVRTDALRVVDAWLDASLRDDPGAAVRLDAPFPGVSP